MNVSGIRPYSGFYQYNSIKLDELRNQKIAAEKPEQMTAVQDAGDDEAKRIRQETERQEAAARQTFGSYDFAQQFKPDEPFDMKGIESDINSLDVEKAVNDLDKDQILKQYQYFVGPNMAAQQDDMQPVLRTGENFTL